MGKETPFFVGLVHLSPDRKSLMSTCFLPSRPSNVETFTTGVSVSLTPPTGVD
jgi:hypothetical protein